MTLVSISSKDQLARNLETFSIGLACKCGQIGSATWEETAPLGDHGIQADHLNVSTGFYLRVQKKNPGKTDIVCGRCDAVVSSPDVGGWGARLPLFVPPAIRDGC